MKLLALNMPKMERYTLIFVGKTITLRSENLTTSTTNQNLKVILSKIEELHSNYLSQNKPLKKPTYAELEQKLEELKTEVVFLDDLYYR